MVMCVIGLESDAQIGLLAICSFYTKTNMPCGVGHITKNSTNVFSACRKRRLKETGRGDWESPPL